MPVAVTEKVTFAPDASVWLTGWLVMSGPLAGLKKLVRLSPKENEPLLWPP